MLVMAAWVRLRLLLMNCNKGKNLSVVEDLSKVAVFSVGMIGPEGNAVLIQPPIRLSSAEQSNLAAILSDEPLSMR